ncbi:MAG TPA: protein translocase subunit SecF [Nitrospina sp.]|jgi:preprotein translocase subunit SecF|nr:protein translocase subunit SecF [Nitrospinota bacterium]MDP6334893.1 protein translocase subunit SecF [Nitrospinaceae bacterium]MDP7147163.1 protein translocase subunit SecF [Nitrospinaceae bacterium]HAX46279.1 protein translocase subunit SecF [Nitrospina sp.]|tara:strand:- start:1092 stop:2003 length:912 start_codon:yes stop_codon:yes gene_type:complete
MEIFKRVTEIDFMGKRGMAVTLSSIAILIGIVSILIHGGLKYGIDFAGGTLVQLKFVNPPEIEEIRDGLKTIGLGESEIQEFGSKNHILIRVERSEGKLEEVGKRVKDSLIGEGKYQAEDIVIERVEMVGPKVGKDLREKALLSIIYAIIGIVIYISWRFEFQYAIAAIIALIHDVMVTMGVFSVADKEFTLVIVAAFLAIIGYSLNDTIVIFDRIRENMRRRGKIGLVDVINTSINQTLSRTILTSGTTLMVVVALFFLGGEIIHDFSFALVIGVLVGTYSSIFIASVFLVYWANRAHPKRA